MIINTRTRNQNQKACNSMPQRKGIFGSRRSARLSSSIGSSSRDSLKEKRKKNQETKTGKEKILNLRGSLPPFLQRFCHAVLFTTPDLRHVRPTCPPCKRPKSPQEPTKIAAHQVIWCSYWATPAGWPAGCSTGAAPAAGAAAGWPSPTWLSVAGMVLSPFFAHAGSLAH